MIIDALTHITRDGAWFGTGLNASLHALLASMDRDGVDKAVLAGIPSAGDDDLVLDAARTYPGRFIPVAGVDVSGPENLETRVKEVRDLGFAGIKLHPRLSGMTMTDPLIREAIKLAGKLDLTALVCTIHRSPLLPLGRPVSDALYDLCCKCDDTRIILVHGGYTDLLATSELIRPLEHVLLDLSLTMTRFACTSIGLDIAWLLETFDRRICVGSDFPEGDMNRVRTALNVLGAAPDILKTMAINMLQYIKPPQTHKSIPKVQTLRSKAHAVECFRG